MGTAVISGRDATPVLQAAEDVLDAMALAIQGLVVSGHGLEFLARRDARGDAPGGQRSTETVTVVAPIGQQFARGRQGIDHQVSALVVVHLSLAWLIMGQKKAQVTNFEYLFNGDGLSATININES